MNCVTSNCKYVRGKVIKIDGTKYFKRVYVPYCQLGKSVSYPFIDDGKKDMRCEYYEKAESEGK
jgi:hypothetical protein